MSKKILLICLLIFGLYTLPSDAAVQGPADFTKVAKKAIPAVVSVKVQLHQPSYSGSDEVPYEDPFQMFGDDLFRRFFRFQQPSPSRPQIGQGSGFIVSEDGYILTNNHIVRDADKIIVTLDNGKELIARVIGKDPSSDLAVIKIDAKNLPTLKLGNSDTIEVGQWVAAIGNPAGLQATLTVGVVSAKDRNNLGLNQFENFIQTDAAINLGNSGGPLLNTEGEVIGINTAIAAHTAGYDGIGFAIPSSMAQQVMEQLLTEGSVTRSYLGIALQKIDSNIADAFQLSDVSGALIAEIYKDSPADKAKLQPGDIILKLNGKPVSDISHFRNIISMMKPGTPVTLLVKRDNQEFQVKIEVAPHPDNISSKEEEIQKLGIYVEPLTQELAQRLNYQNEQGVVIGKIEMGTLASMAGLKKGALIISVNNQSVKSPEEFYNAVKATEKGRPVILRIKQDGQTRFVSLREI